MITFKVDNNEIDYKTVWYHFRDNLKSDDHKFRINITRDEKRLIELFEKMLSANVDSELFLTNGKKSGKDSSYNIVRYTLEWLDELNNPTINQYEVEWTFNTIDQITITSKEIIVEGVASAKWNE